MARWPTVIQVTLALVAEIARPEVDTGNPRRETPPQRQLGESTMPAKPKIRDVSPYVGRGLATCIDPANGCREAKYIIDITDIDEAISKTLNRIRDRDGEKWFKEGAAYLRKGLDRLRVA
jgi:hypothetical protein